jgi:hypothetical protein
MAESSKLSLACSSLRGAAGHVPCFPGAHCPQSTFSCWSVGDGVRWPDGCVRERACRRQRQQEAGAGGVEKNRGTVSGKVGCGTAIRRGLLALRRAGCGASCCAELGLKLEARGAACCIKKGVMWYLYYHILHIGTGASSGLYMTRLRVMDQTQLTGSVSRVDSTHRRCESS